MENINFLTLSKSQCLEVSILVFENSKQKFEEATILAGKGRYNTASSLLIISNEESLKALILFLDGNGFNIRSIKGMKSLFNNHKLRYLFALVISLLSIFTKEFSSLFIKIFSGDSDFLNKIEPNNPDFNLKLKKYLIARLTDVKNEIDFFSKVDKARQQGLYSDYKNGLIKITEKEYQELHSKIFLLNETINTFLWVFNSDEKQLDKYLKDLKKDFNSNYNEKLEVLLKKINSPNVDSYESMLELVNELRIDLLNIPDVDFFTDKENFSKLLNTVKTAKKLKKKIE